MSRSTNGSGNPSSRRRSLVDTSTAAGTRTCDLGTAPTMSRCGKSGIGWGNTFLDLPSELSIDGVG